MLLCKRVGLLAEMAREEMSGLTSDKVERSASCLIESGSQLFRKLVPPRSLVPLHPNLLPCSPKPGEIVEICYDKGTPLNLLLSEIICNAILPSKFGGKNVEAVLILTDGGFDVEILVRKIRRIIHKFDKSHLEHNVNECLLRLHLVTVYDSRQLYVAIQSIENLLSQHENVSLVMLDTIKAFYWSDRMFETKVINMETYIANILSIIRNVTKNFQTVVLYTKFKNTNKYSIKEKEQKKNLITIDHKLHLTSCENFFQVYVDNTEAKKCSEHKLKIENERIMWL